MKNNNKNMVGVVSGTGLVGLKLNNVLPFMSPGFTYPGVTVFHQIFYWKMKKVIKLLVSLAMIGPLKMMHLYLNKIGI